MHKKPNETFSHFRVKKLIFIQKSLSTHFYPFGFLILCLGDMILQWLVMIGSCTRWRAEVESWA
jgi:hypothetical protein